MTVQQFILHQQEPVQQIMVILRTWILDLGRHIEEKISHNVPYFYFYGNLCYISAVGNAVELSFVRGKKLDDETKILESRDRKEVRSVRFNSVAEVEEHEEEVRRLLNEAAIMNEYQFKRKKKH